MVAIGLHRLSRDLHVVEHALELLRELIPALNLEFS